MNRPTVSGGDVGSRRDFFGLSLADLARARALYHVQLLEYRNVVGTALGRYLVRTSDPYPQDKAEEAEVLGGARRQRPPRRLDNSEIRAYSWPCVLVFVGEWIDYDSVEDQDVLLPRQLWLPDGRVVPICVVEATPVPLDRVPAEELLFPGSFYGPGYPLTATVQGGFRVGTTGPLVTDGRRLYALTSRHVLQGAGTEVRTFVHGEELRIGTCAAPELTRVPLGDAYPALDTPGAFLNLDVGLVDVDDVERWTSVAYGIGPLGTVADGGSASLTLALIGRNVVAHGAVGGTQRGQVKGLLFRYKAVGGAEYFTDFLIGSCHENTPLTTEPGDSGTLWCLPPDAPDADDARFAPLAVQWGGEVLHTTSGHTAPYVLASSVATACRLLDLDLVWDRHASLFRYWGGVGHYGIALRAIQALPPGGLKTLMTANLSNVTFPQEQINETDLSGLSKRFVPLADVPDLAWKRGIAVRGTERPNHFADMDAPDANGKTLLDVCAERRRAIDPAEWLAYYERIGVHNALDQGLLPFRVWQLYGAMVDALTRRSVTQFVCAAGVLAHYVGDACQPLHISMYHDGYPDGPGEGVHSAYEDDMVNRHVGDIFAGLQSLPVASTPRVRSGADAAWSTIGLMKRTYKAIDPRKLVDAYVALANDPPSVVTRALWTAYGTATIGVMGDGVATLAGLWLSAWKQAGADALPLNLGAIRHSSITSQIKNADFVRSYTLERIGKQLR